VISKATNPDRDAYSALEGTDLGERLEARQIRRVFVGGLATDYCVRATVLDLIDAGFDVVVIDDAIAAVDAKAGDGDKALRQMVMAGATRANSSQIVASPS
jgi:nicotinamidase/pyrazinamidase